MQEGFAIALRIGVSAGLLISVLSSTVGKVGRQDWHNLFINSILTGVIFSVLIAFMDMLGVVRREGRLEEILEGIGMLILSGGIAWLIVWLRSLPARLQQRTNGNKASFDRVLYIILAMAFLSVAREGFEVIRPLYLEAFISEPASVATGVALALLTSFVISWGLFNYLSHATMERYVRAAAVILLFVGAGLVTNAVHEFTQAGVIPSLGIPSAGAIFFGQKSVFGIIMLVIIGNETIPTLNELFAFSAYLIVLGWIILTAKSSIRKPFNFG